jgi:ABC-type multidrug transport system fused ATPase/permease subunit
MSSTPARSQGLVAALTAVALVAMLAAFFAPIWWVSLTAPNYPKDAFPDGIRIHFHFNGVQNGCRLAGAGSQLAQETMQGDLHKDSERYNPITDAAKDVNKGAKGLDCVHEMNTINHYVGMFPIATGAPVEKPLAKFFFGFFAVMLVAFAVTARKLRLAILAGGFAAVAAWAVVDQYVLGHLARHVADYVKEAGTFFKEPEKIAAWGDNVRLATHAALAGLAVAMAVVVWGVAKVRRFELLLALVPALLPLYFVITYAAWLWFFGHNLHPWGAFTVKPFMPTVFGEGKVAQFSTYSYPYWGYALLVLVFLCLMLALLLRRRALREAEAEGAA